MIALTLDWIDDALMAAGGLVVLAAAVAWWRTGKRDPLRGALIRPNGLTALAVWLCIAVHLFGWSVGGQIAQKLAPASLAGQRLENLQGIAASLFTNSVTILTCLLVGRAAFAGGLRVMGIGRRTVRFDLAMGLVGWLVAMTVTGSLLHVSDWIIQIFFPSFKPPDHTVFQILKDDSTGSMMRVLTLVGAFVVAPIGEELLFRGILQTGLHRILPPKRRSLAHRWIAIMIVGTLFGAVHSGTPQYVPALMALGILLGFLYERTGSLRVCIFVHMIFNGRSLLWDYLMRVYGG